MIEILMLIFFSWIEMASGFISTVWAIIIQQVYFISGTSDIPWFLNILVVRLLEF